MLSTETSYPLPRFPVSPLIAPSPAPPARPIDAPAAPTAPGRSSGFGSFGRRLGDSGVDVYLKGHEPYQSDIAGRQVEGPAVAEPLEHSRGQYRRQHPRQPGKSLGYSHGRAELTGVRCP